MQNMGRKNNGGLLPDPSQQFHNFPAPDGIKGGHRLIQEQQPGTVNQSLGQS
ncbi:hypothetical protein D3C75_1294790 [compost metagenome]